MKHTPTNFLITGGIGIGKTTVINRVLQEISSVVTNVAGFYTKAIWENGIKKGFFIEQINGKKINFAHLDFNTNNQFQRYKISQSVFNEFGVAILEDCLNSGQLIIMDEIGIFEEQAFHFQKKIIECLDASKLVLGVFQERAIWFKHILDKRNDTIIYNVTEINRDSIHKNIAVRIKETFL